MQRVRKSVLVPFSAGEMHALVDDLATYSAFLPWCGGARVLAEGDGHKTARIDIDYHGVRAHFTTDNVNRAGESIVVTLRDGPFRHLHGEWRFRALAPDACKVEFELAYEFTTYVLDGKGKLAQLAIDDRPHDGRGAAVFQQVQEIAHCCAARGADGAAIWQVNLNPLSW